MAHELSRELCNPMAGQRFIFQGEESVLGGDLGDGAVGLVRKATRTKDNARRAVKFLAPDPKYIDEAIFDDVAARFKREGERGAKLRHAHLLTIFSHCENEDGELFESREPKNPFLLMEQVQGRTLESYIRKRRSEERGKFAITRDRLHIAIQVVNALDELHRVKSCSSGCQTEEHILVKNTKRGFISNRQTRRLWSRQMGRLPFVLVYRRPYSD